MRSRTDFAKTVGRLVSMEEFRNRREAGVSASILGRSVSVPAESIERCLCPACLGAEKYLAVALKARSRDFRPRADRMRLLPGGRA
jgi:hypothetical protein